MKISFTCILIVILFCALQSLWAQDELLLVKPNLGCPDLLTPDQLRSGFTVTIAGTTPLQLLMPQLLGVLQNYEAGLVKDETEYYRLRFMAIPSGLVQYQAPSDNFPVTSNDHKHAAGFKWEVKVHVTVEELIQPQHWPQLFDISFKKSGLSYNVINHNAVYVDPRMDNPRDFTVIHLTDMHLAGRYDRIPEVLAETRTPSEIEELNQRYVNPNENMRRIIEYANWKVQMGEPVFIISTGDLIDYVEDNIPENYNASTNVRPDRNKNNIQIVRELILRQDGRGEKLRCPIFMTMGNHEYLTDEPPLFFSIVVINNELGSDYTHDMPRYSGYGLNKNEAFEYNYWSKGFPKQGSQNPDVTRGQIKNGLKNYKYRLNSHQAYRLVNPVTGYLFDYLTEFFYDTDYNFQIGPHQFLILNTGEDIIPSHNSILWYQLKNFLAEYGVGFGTYTQWDAGLDPKKDFHRNGTHNRGITQEHIDLLSDALNSAVEKSMIFSFSHASFFSLPYNRTNGMDIFHEDFHKSIKDPPPNTMASVFFRYMMLNEPTPVFGIKPTDQYAHSTLWREINQWFPQGGTFYFYKNMDFSRPDFRRWFAYGSSEGLVNEFLSELYTNTTPPVLKKPFIFFSGHTHKIHEFRITWNETDKFCLHLDDYSNSTEWNSTHAIVNTYDPELSRRWLNYAAPLFINSGTPKHKDASIREIVFNDNEIFSLKMISALEGITNRIVLKNSEGYNFAAKEKCDLMSGDFYFSNNMFFANNVGQKGVHSLGNIGFTKLDQVDIPSDGYRKANISALQNHTYVLKAREGENIFVVFRVYKVSNDEVTIDYQIRQPYRISLFHGEGYDFSDNKKCFPVDGDLYLSNLHFMADHPDQMGIVDLGEQNDIPLSEINIPEDGYAPDLPAIRNHTYIAKARHDEFNHYIKFRVFFVGGTKVSLDYSYTKLESQQQRVVLNNGKGYLFADNRETEIHAGDFYLINQNFFGNNVGQSGLVDIGNLGNQSLNEIQIPENGSNRFGVPVQIGHVYASKQKEGTGNKIILFRVYYTDSSKTIVEYVLRAGLRRLENSTPGIIRFD